MKFKTLGVVLLLCGLWPVRAAADQRFIVRSTRSLGVLQEVCNPPLLPSLCTVVGGLGDPQGQLFLITSPLDLSTLLNLLGNPLGIVNVEVDQLLSLIGGLNRVTTPPAALFDSAPVAYYNSRVWNGYVDQPAAEIVHVSAAQTQFQIAGSGIVADIDTGIDPNHPAFAGVLLQGFDFTRNQQGASELSDLSPADFPSWPPPCPPSTCQPATVNQSTAAVLDQSTVAVLDGNVQYAAFGHGTMVMGVIHLVAPKAYLLPLKTFKSDGTGFLSDILRAIYYGVQSNANVINMSFDIKTSSVELSNALDYANQQGVICASSAGNDGQAEMVYPAGLQNDVMGVASTNDLDQRSYFSNFGDSVVWIDAPGEAIVTTYPFSTYAAGWGTSFSAPFVSGGAALLRNLQPSTNESQAAAALAHAVWIAPEMGNGRLDLVEALSATGVTRDFSIPVSPSRETIRRGTRRGYAVTVAALGSFTGTVTLSVTGLPRRTSAAFNPPTITGFGSSVLTLYVGYRAQPGTYRLTITGTSGSLVHSTNAILQIQ